MASETLIVAIVLISAFMAAIAQYIFKRRMPKFDFNLKGLLSLATNKAIIAGIVVYAASLVIYLSALRLGELSFVYPTFASVFVFVLLISRFKLKEEVSWKRVAGVVLVMIGIIIVALTY